MTLRLGMPRRLLVIAPHADDEAIGAHAMMTRLKRRGVTVQVIVVADGAASHPSSVRWPRRRLVAERRRESRRVLRQIGVAAAAVTFLDLPDGLLTRRRQRRVAASLAQSGRTARRLSCRPPMTTTMSITAPWRRAWKLCADPASVC